MILQALYNYYETLAARGEISRPGWTVARISHALEISATGELLSVFPLKTLQGDGKKLVAREMNLPAPVKRTAGVAANFLWDNAMYMLGFDLKGNPERAKQCFTEAKKLHLELLGEVADPFAKAICSYFENWNPDSMMENPIITDLSTEMEAGDNFVFIFERQFASENTALGTAWQQYYDNEKSGEMLRCLVTGNSIVPEATHPAIKNVRDAKSSGAALVTFNSSAFCSYGREQNLNAPVGKYAAFAYTTALNRLLSNRKNVVYIGDTTVVFWAESAEEEYQNAFTLMLNNDDSAMTDKNLRSILDKLSRGMQADWDSVPLEPNNRFYVLGLSPNSSRISVRFFLCDSFGNFARHSQAHYAGLEIVKPEFEALANLPLWMLMRETMNPNSTDKKSSPQMSGDTLRSILTGARYPTTLFQSVEMRIRADRKINYRRAAIIKSYLLRNSTNEAIKEVLTVQLNEDTTYQPYVLGRTFAILESIQKSANPAINTTIKDKYLSSACATPAKIFPILFNLSQKHLRKMEKGKSIYFSKQLGGITSRLTESLPVHHTLEDQGIFQIGYYHQQQKQYEKKNSEAETKEGNENG